MFDIAQVIVNAHTFNPRKERVVESDLFQAVNDFFAELDEQRVEYVLVGGIAVLNYVAGRNTEDVDLIVSAADLPKLPQLTIKSQDNDFATADYQGLKVDLLLTSNKLFRLIRDKYVTQVEFAQRSVRCVTVAGLVLLKLYALPSLYREGRFERVYLYETDITMLLSAYLVDVGETFTVLSRYLSLTDITSLRPIVAEIEARIARTKGGF